MDEVKPSWRSVLIVCAIIGLFSSLATRKIFLGIGIMLALYLSWGMWSYIKDITKGD